MKIAEYVNKLKLIELLDLEETRIMLNEKIDEIEPYFTDEEYELVKEAEQAAENEELGIQVDQVDKKEEEGKESWRSKMLCEENIWSSYSLVVLDTIAAYPQTKIKPETFQML